jgi:hypothetical protein
MTHHHSGGEFHGQHACRCGKQAAARFPAGPAQAGSQTSATGAAETVASAMQLAIGLLTASLDSAELEARALPVLMPSDADGLADLIAGLHLISKLMIRELHEATGEPAESTLQRLAILAEHLRGMPSIG